MPHPTALGGQGEALSDRTWVDAAILGCHFTSRRLLKPRRPSIGADPDARSPTLCILPIEAANGNSLIMASSKHSAEFEIAVGGEPYVWRLHRLPGWSSDAAERRGMAIAVRHTEGQREVVVEFPPGPQPRYGAPQLKASQIDPKIVTTAIASAIAAGWEPLSRGKTVVIVVDASGA